MIRTLATSFVLILVAAVVAAAPPAKVGALGDPSVIVFEGNKVFSDEELRRGLAWSPDFWVAAHPDAELARFADDLHGLMREGYRHGGFADVEIAVTPEPAKDRILVTVKEGTRYVAGEPRLSGIEGPEAEKLTSGVLNALLELEWEPGGPAKLDQRTRRHLERAVANQLALLGRHAATFVVGMDLDHVAKKASPVVRIEKLGGPGIVATIEVRGLVRHTPEQVVAWLGVNPGDPADSGALTALHTRLEDSGRFAGIRMKTEPGENPAKGVHFVLDLVETLDVPNLDEELSPEMQALLKFQKWLADLASSGIELHGTIEDQAEFVLDPARGLVLGADLTKLGLPLRYSLVVEADQCTLLSHHSRVALSGKVEGAPLRLLLGVTVDAEDPDQPGALRVSAGLFPVDKKPGAVDLLVVSRPAAFLRMASKFGSCTLKEGKLVLESTEVRVIFDATTGQLVSVQGVGEGTVGTVRVRATTGAFEEAGRRLCAIPDSYLRIRGFGSFGEGLAQFVALDRLRDGPGGGVDSTILAAVFGKTFQAAMEGLHVTEDPGFTIPWDKGDLDSTEPDIQTIALMAGNLLFARGTWPRDVAREAALVAAGKSMRTGIVLSRLYQSDEVGPLGHLTIAALLDMMDSPAAPAFAKKGLSMATPEAFERDVAVLVDQGGALGRILQQLAAAVRGLSSEDRTALGAILSETNRKHLVVLYQTWDATKGQNDQAAAAAALRYLYKAGLGEWMRQSLETLAGE